jgi:hypothetical protein
MSDFQYRMWTYLITYVDDYGRGSADPELVRSFVFPRRKGLTEATVKRTIEELATMGSLILYEVDGDAYLCFPNWSEHQTVRNKVSKFPAPEDGKLLIASNCMQLKANAPVIQSNPIQSNPNTESIYTPYSPPSGGDGETEDGAFSEEFLKFWDIYPKKVGKNGAYKSWVAMRKNFIRSGVMDYVEMILSAVRSQSDSEQWKREGGRFIPSPAKWLNEGRWEDELPAVSKTGGEGVGDSTFDTNDFFETALRASMESAEKQLYGGG